MPGDIGGSQRGLIQIVVRHSSPFQSLTLIDTQGNGAKLREIFQLNIAELVLDHQTYQYAGTRVLKSVRDHAGLQAPAI